MKIIIKAELRAFLEQENALEKFKNNFNRRVAHSKLKKECTREARNIWHAFEWERTPEGHNYWQELSDRYGRG